MSQNEIQRMLPRHFRILELTLHGLSRSQVAEEIGMSPEGVGLILKSPIFQSELSRQREELLGKTQEAAQVATEHSVARAQEILQGAASQAAEKHVTLLQSEDEAIAQRSANSILDRVLGKTSDSSNTIVVEKGAVQLLMLALQEGGLSESRLVSNDLFQTK